MKLTDNLQKILLVAASKKVNESNWSEETARFWEARHLIETQFCYAKPNVLWTFGEDTRGSGQQEGKRE